MPKVRIGNLSANVPPGVEGLEPGRDPSAGLGRVSNRCGFRIHRNTNDAAVVTGSQINITFNALLESAGSWTAALAGIAGGFAGLTVPPGAGGVYALSAGVYWGAIVGDVYVSIHNLSIAYSQAVPATTDRGYVNALAILRPGDVIAVRFINNSGSTLTPIAYSGDPVSPILPSFSAWRISG